MGRDAMVTEDRAGPTAARHAARPGRRRRELAAAIPSGLRMRLPIQAANLSTCR